MAPIFPPALYADAFTLLTRGAYTDAVDLFRQAFVRDPLSRGRSEGDRLAKAARPFATGMSAPPSQHLKAVVESAPNRAEAHRILAVAHRETDQHDDSIEEFKTAIS